MPNKPKVDSSSIAINRWQLAEVTGMQRFNELYYRFEEIRYIQKATLEQIVALDGFEDAEGKEPQVK